MLLVFAKAAKMIMHPGGGIAYKEILKLEVLTSSGNLKYF